MSDSNQVFCDLFADREAVSRYAEGPPRFMPGFEALHRMAIVLLSEHVADDALLLILGAGGGLELKAFADAKPGWRFTGVDPAAPMLDLARQTLGGNAARAELVEGYVDAAPPGPFDGATCLLTLHFLPRDERVRTLRELNRRLVPGAPLVVAHSSFPQDEPERTRWLARYAAFARISGTDEALVEQAHAAVSASLATFTPEEDEACLREAGFAQIEPFYAAFTWRGWVARA